MDEMKPSPDSQFRLRPCKCGSDNVAFAQYRKDGHEPWRVRCFDCGFTVDKESACRHDVQVLWNTEVSQ